MQPEETIDLHSQLSLIMPARTGGGGAGAGAGVSDPLEGDLVICVDGVPVSRQAISNDSNRELLMSTSVRHKFTAGAEVLVEVGFQFVNDVIDLDDSLPHVLADRW